MLADNHGLSMQWASFNDCLHAFVHAGARLQMLADNLDVPFDSLAPLLLASPALFTSPQVQ
jgi:hypothetical protein